MGRPYWEIFPRQKGPLAACLMALKNNCPAEEKIHVGEKIYFSRSFPVNIDQANQYSVHVLQDITSLEFEKSKNEHLILNLLEAIGVSMEQRDPYTAGHQYRVAHLAKAIAEEMGLSENQIQGIYLGALVHDIGKIRIPAEILSSPRRLNTAEFELIKMHPQTGALIVSNISFPWPIKEIIEFHHERLDGSGYPHGLKSDDLIMAVRIVSVADVFEAMSSHRPYRPKRSLKDTINEVHTGAGVIYDEMVVNTCIKLFAEKRFTYPKLNKNIQLF